VTRKLARLGIALWAGALPVWGEPWAIFVGVDDYLKESIPDLRCAGADAKLLATAFQELLQVPADHCFLFTSDQTLSNQTPTTSNILFRLEWLQKRVKAGDTVIVFFAGHGATVEGESFLLTEESDNRSLTSMKVSALQAAELDRLLGKLPASQVMVVIDACRNDPSQTSTSSGRTVSSRFEESVKLQACTLFSCQVGERSWEWAEKKHGFFSYFLAEGLRGGAADSQGWVGLTQLTQFLGERVSREVERVVKVKQTPILRYEGPVDANWRFGRVAAGAAPLAKLEKDAAVKEATQARLVELQSRVQLEETRRRELEVKLADLEKRSTAPSSEEIQKLTISRDLALKELLETQKQLEQTRRQLLDRGGVAGAEMNLMLAERDQLKAENRVLAARIDLLESKLKATGVSLARSFTIEGPVAGEVEWQESQKLALAEPTPEHLLRATEGEVAVLLQKAILQREQAALLNEQLGQSLDKMGALWAQSEKDRDEMRQRLEELELREQTFEVQCKVASRSIDSAQRVAAWERLREAWELMAERPNFRRRAISQRYYLQNSLAGLGDILDIPIKISDEAQGEDDLR
jgi:uncharacterized caspase-like protein